MQESFSVAGRALRSRLHVEAFWFLRWLATEWVSQFAQIASSPSRSCPSGSCKIQHSASPSRSCSLATPFTNMDAGHKLSCFNDPNTCFFTDLWGFVEEVLLASRKPKFYCAVTLGLPLLGMSGLLNFVAQILGTVLGAVILTLLYSGEGLPA